MRNPASGWLEIGHKLEESNHVKLFWHSLVFLVKFSYWSKFHANIMTGSRVMTIFSFVKYWPEIRNLENTMTSFYPISGGNELCPIFRDWGELVKPNLAQVPLIKFY